MSQAQLCPTASPFVSLHSGRPATTSLEVAKFFGKQHAHVLRSVKELIDNTPKEFTASNFGVSEYTDETGRTLPLFILHRDGFMLLVMGYTGKKAMQLKIAYIEAFNAMEAQLMKSAPRRGRKALPAAKTHLQDELIRSQQRHREDLEQVISWVSTMQVQFNGIVDMMQSFIKIRRDAVSIGKMSA